MAQWKNPKYLSGEFNDIMDYFYAEVPSNSVTYNKTYLPLNLQIF